MMTPKPRVLVVHPGVYPPGGDTAVAAWALEALRGDFDLTLATLVPLDYEGLNVAFGTSLRPGDVRVAMAPQRVRTLLQRFPTDGGLLRICLTMRWAQDLDRRHKFDVLFGVRNEIDFHRRGIQFVHYPWTYVPRSEDERAWFHRLPGAMSMYRWTCKRLARATSEGLKRNVSLAGSTFVASRLRDALGDLECVVLYPPVHGGFPDTPWEQRCRGFVAIGRLGPTKRWPVAVSILDRVRAQGHDVSLTIVAHSDDPLVRSHLEELRRTRPWFRLLIDLPRRELVGIVAGHRYGLHAMVNEHFGIAAGELQRAGCVTFVHKSGGPAEIVGGDERLTWTDEDDAARKIDRVLRERDLEADLRRHGRKQAEHFTAEEFCRSLRQIVARELPEHAA